MNRFIKGMFADYSLGQKLLLLFGIFIIMEVTGNVIGLGCGLAKDVLLSEANTIRLEQFVASLIIFIGTPYVFYFLTSKPECTFIEFFKFSKRNGFLLYLLAILALAFLIPLVNYTAYFNEQMSLPESLHFIEEKMKYMEDLAKEITMQLLETDSFFMLIINIIVIAAAPAIGEELMFRGAIQKTLQDKKSPLFAIIITSVIFSAMHFQFYGFVPRFILSVFLGMLYYFSGSIRLNMFAHFCNNAVAVVAVYICTLAKIPLDDAPTESLGKEDFSSVAIATLMFAFLMWAIYKIAKKNTKEEPVLENNADIEKEEEEQKEPQQSDPSRFMPHSDSSDSNEQ